MDAIFPKPTNAVFSCIFVDINTKYLWIILSGYECRNYGEFKKTFSVHTNGDEGFCYATWIPCTISSLYHHDATLLAQFLPCHILVPAEHDMLARVILGLPHQPFHISAPKAETTSQIHTRRVTGLRETFASWLLGSRTVFPLDYEYGSSTLEGRIGIA